MLFERYRVGLLERMPILDKTINTPALANGDAQAGLDEDETLPYTNNVGSHATPTMSPTNQVSALSVGVLPSSAVITRLPSFQYQ